MGRHGGDGDDDRARPARPDGHAAGPPPPAEALARDRDARPSEQRSRDPGAGSRRRQARRAQPVRRPVRAQGAGAPAGAHAREAAALVGGRASSRSRCSSRGSRSGSPGATPTAARCAAPRTGRGTSSSTCPAPRRSTELAAELPGPHFELVTEVEPGEDPGPWVAAGATWALTTYGPDPDPDSCARRSTPGRDPPRSVRTASRPACAR